MPKFFLCISSIKTYTCLMFMYDICFIVNVNSIGYQHKKYEIHKKLYEVNWKTLVRVRGMPCRSGEVSAFYFWPYYSTFLPVIYKKRKEELYTSYFDKLHRTSAMLIQVLCRIGEVSILKHALGYVLITTITLVVWYMLYYVTLSIGHSPTSLSIIYKHLNYMKLTPKYGELFE